MSCGGPLPTQNNGWVKCSYCGTNHHISEKQVLSIKKPTQHTENPLSKKQIAMLMVLGLVAMPILMKYMRKR